MVAGTILGRLGESTAAQPHLLFEIRPAGRGAPRVDPKPILDGWKLLESTAIYRAAGKNPFFGADAANPSIGQILLMSKEALIQPRARPTRTSTSTSAAAATSAPARSTAACWRRSSSSPHPACGRRSPRCSCGHSYLTTSGNVSEHSSGNAVDIAAINGITISPATQGKGSITEITIQRLLTLQGTMKPHQIISLMKFEGTDNTFAMGDHHDHIHVGFQPLYGDQLEDGPPGQRDPQAEAVDQADRPPRRDRQPRPCGARRRSTRVPAKRSASQAHKGD